MIYTVTFNPSLDYIVSVPGFELGKTNRTESEQLLPGGKGINVSILLNHIGIESTALGFVQALLEKRLSVSFRYRASIQILFRWKMDVRVSI